MAKEARNIKKVQRDIETLHEAQAEAAQAKRDLEDRNNDIRRHPPAAATAALRPAEPGQAGPHPAVHPAEPPIKRQEDLERIRRHSEQLEQLAHAEHKEPAASGESFFQLWFSLQYSMMTLWIEAWTRMANDFWSSFKIDGNADKPKA